MFEFASRIKPLLTELDDVVPLHRPVPIDVIIDLTKQHSDYKTIRLAAITKRSIAGTHIAFPETGNLLIFYRPCSVHSLGSPDRSCPECRWARFILAKELSHAFDCSDEQTPAKDAEELVIKESLKGTFANKQAQADLFGTLWGAELLVRYLHRVEMTGGGVLAESPRLTSAKSTGDFSYFADQFCIPPNSVESLFKDTIMKAMKTIRQKVGLPTFLS